MTSCPFCQILAGELPSSPVFENDIVMAFLDIRPAHPGHTLVIPRRHVESFTDLRAIEVEQMARCCQRVAAAMKRTFACEGVTLSLADGVAAGQDVPHAHFHVVPRRHDDGFGWRAAGALAGREALDDCASQLRTALSAASKTD